MVKNNSNYIDTINHISDTYQRGVYALAIEYVYIAIKKMIRNGIKSNDDAYIDLFELRKKYWINGYSSENYINDLIQLTYIDILESIPTDVNVVKFIEGLGENITVYEPENNYDLHGIFNMLYYKANPLKDYQKKVVNRVRSYYRNKGDLIERCEPKTVNTVAIEHACNQLEKQRVIELVEQKELVDKINEIVENCTKAQRQVFELRVEKGYSYKQIAGKVGISPSSSANLFNKVVGRIRANIDLDQYKCGSNYADIYSIGIQQEEEVPE